MSSIWRLCSVGALPASGAIKYYAGLVFPLCHHSPCEVSSPCTALDGGTWELGCAFKGGSISIEGEIVVFGEPWSAPLLPLLVPSSLAPFDAQMEGDNRAA